MNGSTQEEISGCKKRAASKDWKKGKNIWNAF